MWNVKSAQKFAQSRGRWICFRLFASNERAWALIKLHLRHNNSKHLPLVILYDCTSFSQDANDAFSTSVSFLLVPGVSGGICGWSAIEECSQLIKMQLKHKSEMSRLRFIHLGWGVTGQTQASYFVSLSPLSSIVYHHLLLFSIATNKRNVIIIF